MIKLVGISYSPWTLQVEWALKHKRIEYNFRNYLPLVDELYLQLVLRSRSVPVLIDRDFKINQSFAISKYIDYRFPKRSLIIGHDETKIAEIHQWMESTTDLGRKILIILLGKNKEGRFESLPDSLPNWFKKVLAPASPMAISRLAMKYDVDLESRDLYNQLLKDRFKEISKKVTEGQYILGEFSYADIMVALSLQNLKPVDDEFIRSKPIFRMYATKDYCDEDWAKKLLKYRDFIFENHWPR